MKRFLPSMHRHLFLFVGVLAVALGAASGVESYLIVDNQTGHILAAKEADAKRQIASLTKIATAVVVLDWSKLTNADLGELVTVPAEAVSVGGVNSTGLQPNDLISLRDLLYSALMASDNAAAQTLAYHIGRRLPNAEGLDPTGNFVAHMNALARDLGMKRTRFLNPSGLDNGSGGLPFSTATDLGRLTHYAYSKSAFPFYVAQPSREIHLFRGGQPMSLWLKNTNPLLGQDGIDGVKTGRTSKSGDCIILSADRPPESRREGVQVIITPRRIIVVLLGADDRAREGLGYMRKG
ncbi:MAG: serine hydrolase, partial [Terrimicrobiaceae bacterium]|nr:serine hydrolase [Terrimicrobiaceae bacterium]